MKNKTNINLVSPAVLIGTAGVAVYSFIKTYKSIRNLKNINLDFDDDLVLSSLFKKV